MPGLVGIIVDAGATGRLAAIEAGMPLDPSWRKQAWNEDADTAALAVFARDDTSATAIAAQGDYVIAFDGELYGVSCPRDRRAAYLLQRFVESGPDALRDLEGRFVAAVWCAETESLWLLADKFASKPVYYCHDGGRFAFSTSVNALKSCFGAAAPIHTEGLVQFFTFGHLWNDHTFYGGIKAAMPAMCLEYSVRDASVHHSSYWRPQAQASVDRGESLRAITDSLHTAVRQQSEATEGLGVALSGGLDARTMLALVDTTQVQPACVSLGMEGSLDQRSARRLAELAGCPFHSMVLGEGFLENFRGHLERMVQLTDGHYLSQCIVMPTFPLYQQLGVRVLMRGHVGELLHMHKAYNFSVDDAFHQISSPAQLQQWLMQRLQSHLTEGVQEPLLMDVDANEFAAIGQQSLQDSLAATDHFDHPLDRISQLFLDQRTRRETAMSLVKFNSVVDTRLPYLDSRFIDAVFATGPALRVGEEIQTHILRSHRPTFLRPPNSNTGAPVGVSSLRRSVSYFNMRVLAKLGVKGYQPYERLGLWLRRELKSVVEDILLDARCLDRGLLNPDCVRNSVARHFANQQNHTFLIMAMMIVELGMRSDSAADAKSNSPVQTVSTR